MKKNPLSHYNVLLLKSLSFYWLRQIIHCIFEFLRLYFIVYKFIFYILHAWLEPQLVFFWIAIRIVKQLFLYFNVRFILILNYSSHLENRFIFMYLRLFNVSIFLFFLLQLINRNIIFFSLNNHFIVIFNIMTINIFIND